MPAKGESRKVLEGRAEVLSYAKRPDVFYLRTYVPEKEGYRSQKIEGVSDLETACRAALEVYLDLSKSGTTRASAPSVPTTPHRERPSKGVKRVLITDSVTTHIKDQYQRFEAGLIGEGYWEKIEDILLFHFLPYCELQGLVYTRDLKVGCLDDFPTHQLSKVARTTLKQHLITIKAYLKALARKRLLDPYEAALIDVMIPKVKMRDIDYSANPPFRDEQEWLEFVKVIHQWVKEGEKANNSRILYYRRRFWSLIMLLKQTGARPVEALNLKWSDIETEDIGRISESQKQLDEQELLSQGVDPSELPDDVREQLGRVPRFITHLRIIDTKTGTPREVTSNSAEVLARWKKFQVERVAFLNKKYPAIPMELTRDTKVFDFPMGGDWKPTDYSTYTETWRMLMERAEPKLKGPLLSDKPYRIYSLRSSRAQELLNLGVDVAVAAKSMGHSASTMLRVYARLPVRSQAMKAAVAGITFGKRKKDSRIVELEEVQK
jgi:integrase